jgi:hypothetical protein
VLLQQKRAVEAGDLIYRVMHRSPAHPGILSCQVLMI